MKKIILISCLIILFSSLIFFSNKDEFIDSNITGNPDFEPTLGITKESFLSRVHQLNKENEITLDLDTFITKNDQLIYSYNDSIKIQTDFYSNGEIGDLLITASPNLTEEELENEVKPIAHFLVQCINKTSKKQASKIINEMDFSLGKSSYKMSENTEYIYEFYYLESHGYIFVIRTSAMGH